MAAKTINICKISTWKLRELTGKQLRRAGNRGVLRRYEATKEDDRAGNTRGLLSRFIFALRASTDVQDPRSATAADRRFFEKQRKTADLLEREIWRRQLQHGCQIPAAEVAARDAILSKEYTPEQIDAIRGRRRPKIR